MKKILCLVLAVVLVMVAAVACTSTPSTETNADANGKSESTAAQDDKTGDENKEGEDNLDVVTFIVPREVEVIEDAHIHVAEAMGYFEELGIKVDIQQSFGTSDIKMVAAGQGDVCFPSPYISLTGIESGLDIVNVYQVLQEYHFGFAVNPDKGITDIAQLAGKKIVLGDAGWSMIADPILKACGVDPASVEYIVASENRAQVGWEGKEADAVLTWEMEYQVWQGQGMDFQFLNAFDRFKAVGNSLTISRKTLEEKPDVIQRFLQGFAMGSYFTKLNPEAACEIVLDKFPSITTTWNDAVAVMKSFGEVTVSSDPAIAEHGYGYMDPTRWQTIIDMGVELGTLSEAIPVDKVIDNQFIEKINEFDHARVEQDAESYQVRDDH